MEDVKISSSQFPEGTMTLYLTDKYVGLLTDFGFKQVFGTELNKRLLLDFLNTLLPENHQIKNLTFKNRENTGNTSVDRRAIFDIYCQSENGDDLRSVVAVIDIG
jgi:PD-(D/E)XK nuclease family transposase